MSAQNVLADLLVRFGVDNADLRKGLLEMQSDLQRFPKSVKPANDAMGGFAGSLKAFVREERSASRAAGFFVNEAAQVIPISGQARGALTQFGGALLQGGVIGIGVAAGTAALGLLVNRFVEQSQAADEALKKAREWGAGLHAELTRNIDAARLLAAEMAGGALGRSQVASDIARADAAKKQADATRERAAAEAELARLQAEMERTGTWFGLGAAQERVRVSTQAEADAIANYAEVVKRTDLELTQVRARNAEEQTRKIQAEFDKQEAAAKKTAAEVVKAFEAGTEFYRMGNLADQRVVINPMVGLDGLNSGERRRVGPDPEVLRAYQDELKKTRDQMREFSDLGVATFFNLALAAGQGTDAIIDAFRGMLDSLLSIFQRMASEWVFAQLMGTGKAGAGGLTGGGLGAGVSAPELIPMSVPGVSGKLAPVGAGGPGSGGVTLVINGDVVDPEGWLQKNRRALAGTIRTLAYEGGIS